MATPNDLALEIRARIRRNATRHHEWLIAAALGAACGILALSVIDGWLELPIVFVDRTGKCIRVESHRGYTCEALPDRYQRVEVGPYYGT